ncbi:MAG: PPC domain-containing protein, partial [Planctomycetales bacterium]|nr:PPC domain-containing protein [Planctomycetales bacterium]
PDAFSADNNPLVNNPGNDPPPSHFGHYIDDGDVLVIDADRTRLRMEFEDLAGGDAGNPVAGSGQVEGNGYDLDSSIAWYRDTGGDFYQRSTCTNCTAFATNAFETMHALRDSLLGSILVTNGTTQIVTATVAESLLGPDPGAPSSNQSRGYPEYFNRPALYLEGVSNLQWQDTPGGRGNPFDIRQLDLGEVPQPHARIVNNTIIGKDGRASFNGEAAQDEPNDTLSGAVQTWQGTSHNPLAYTSDGVIGDTTLGPAATDVDIYQFKLGLGERAIIDVNSTSGVDTVLQIFDSRGIPQSFVNAAGATLVASDNDAAPGETLGLDPYGDFTATAPGVYYAAISSIGNTAYDPLSLANRLLGTTTGAYTISVGVRHLQNFVITAEDASAYVDGDTFTLYGVPDIGSTGSSGRTFEFTFGGGAATGNIPIQLDASWRFPDVANAIAKAINEGDAGQPSIRNEQALPNGILGTASPLPPVHARALGGL